ncbi:lipocalin family protein [Bacteroidota bacterium]
MTKTFLSLLTMLSFLSCKHSEYLPTVKKVNLEKYADTWYEIARLPNRFEKGLVCVTAKYTLKENGKIDVLNKGHLVENREKIKEAKGVAWVPDPNYPGRLKVRFFWPFAGNYYIISLDENYTWALIGDPSRKYLWILSKNKVLDDKIFNQLVVKAKDQGFDIKKLIKIEQSCE